jgi:cytochrome c-type biogenesis protein CcmH
MPDRMLRWARLGLTLALAAFVVGSVVLGPPPERDRVEAIGRQIRCPVCSGESIADSPAQLARDMMTRVDELVDAGLTDDQVIDEVLAAYGTDAQRLDPPLSARTVALWLIPTLVLAGGIGIVASRRRRSDPPADVPSPGTAPAREQA